MGTQLPETCTEVEINILRSSVHLVGFIWKGLYREARSTKGQKSHCLQRMKSFFNSSVQYHNLMVCARPDSVIKCMKIQHKQREEERVIRQSVHVSLIIIEVALLLLLLLLSSSLSSSSLSSPLCRVLILIFLRQSTSLGNTVLHLFCYYYYYYHHHHHHHHHRHHLLYAGYLYSYS